MKKSLLVFVLALLVAAPLSAFGTNVAQAGAPLSANTAIRGQSAETVYWYANDGKRYVFPNAATYFTWFPSWDSVRTITDADLISIPLGGNVTYRPGAKLVKINTDPRTYAVSKGGVLRHVTSESLASQLYGSDWRTDVHDVPDVYFTNYTVGTPIYNTSDYNVSNEYNGVFTPSDSLRATNGSTQTGDLVLNASRTNINPGEAVVLSIANTSGYGSGHRIEIYDTRTNGLVRTCNLPTSYCDVTVYPQRNANENSVQYYAALRDSSSTTIKSGYSPVVYFGTTNGTQFSSGSSSLEANRTTANVGETVTLTARATNLNTNESNIRMELYRESNDYLVETCYDRATCMFNVALANDGLNTIRFYVIVKNDANEQIPAAYSGRITINGGSNNGDGMLSIWTDKSSINSGDSITVSAWSSETFNASRIEVRDERDNSLVFTCYSVQSCSQSRTFFRRNTSENSFRLYAQLKGWDGNVLRTAYTPTITFNGTMGALTMTVNGSSASVVPVSTGQTAVFTAHSNQTLPYGYHIKMYVAAAHGPYPAVQTCYTQDCSVSYVVPSYVLHHGFCAQILDGSENIISTNAACSDIENNAFNVNGSSSNDGVNYINGLVLNADRTSINAGERVTLTANAFNAGNWNYTGNRIEILDVRTGNIVKTCYDVSTCVADVYPQAQSATNLTAQYQARIYDRTGVLAMSQYSPVIYLTSYNGSNGNSTLGSGLITFAPTDALHPNRNAYLTATFTGSNIALADAQVRIYTEQSSTPIAICNNAYNCSVSYPTGSSPMTTRIYGQLSNRFNVGTYAETPRVNLTTTW